jgi:hypothetical protein
MQEIDEIRKKSKAFAERISYIIANEFTDLEEAIKYGYQDESFLLWWGERGDLDTQAVVTFEQLRTLNDEELEKVIRSTIKGI